jgi:hypothetical protein
MSTQSLVLHDQSNQSHTLIIGEGTLLLDGMVAAIVALEDNQVVLVSPSGTIAFSYIVLGTAILGDRPTPSVAGQLLALYLSRWSALQACIVSLKRLQASIGPIMTEVQPWLNVPLPAYQFDEVTRRALDTFDGTEETTRMLARILNQTPEIVVAWARQLGKGALDTPAPSPASIDKQPSATLHRHEEKSVQAVMKPVERFRWTDERVQSLEEDFLKSTVEGTFARMHAIADQRGWPFPSVRAKVYELKLPQHRSSPRETETSDEQEGHLSEEE